MLGERIGDELGKVTMQRILPNPTGAPKMEITFKASGRILGVEYTDTGTYCAVLRPDGCFFGEGQGVLMGKDGEVATWTGQGIGRAAKSGATSYRGCVYYQTSSEKWLKLNSTAAMYEYEVDADGNTRCQLFEWK